MLVQEKKVFEFAGKVMLMAGNYNDEYFDSSEEMIQMVHGLVLRNYVGSHFFGNFVGFLEDSFKNNNYLNDYFSKCEFEVIDEVVHVKTKDDEYQVKNMGSYSIMDDGGIVLVVVSGGYLYVRQNDNDYVYYGD